MKDKIIKWLQLHIDEIEINSISMKIDDEDSKLNDKDVKELKECIKWLNKSNNRTI